MDRQFRSRLVVYAMIGILVVVGALEPGVGRVFALALLVPITFALVAGFVWGVAAAAGEHAEGHHMPWKKGLDFVEHNAILGFVDLFILWMTTLVASMGWATMGVGSKIVFVAAASVGFAAALRDWFLANEADEVQRGWQHHP